MEAYFYYFIIIRDDNNIFQEENKKTMHLFKDDMNLILSPIEYIMHLPRNIYDLYDLEADIIKSSYDTPHIILILPDWRIRELEKFSTVPTMFILLDNCLEETKQLCDKFEPVLGTIYAQNLNHVLIKELWYKLWECNKSSDFEQTKDIDVHFKLESEKLKALPVLFLSRRFGETNVLIKRVYNVLNIEESCLNLQFYNISRINALALMKDKGKFDLEEYEALYKIERNKFDVSVIVTFPGVSKLQMKYGSSAKVLYENEKRAIRVMGVHRAIARSGILIELSCAGTELFHKYDELEQRCKKGPNNKYIWKVLIKLGKLFANYLSSYQIQVLKRAKDITVFSDFPIGLVILEGEEVPLQCYKNISYRPITPLFNTMQLELKKTSQYYLEKKCKIAIAECIINNEENKYVYGISNLLFKTLIDIKKDYTNLEIAYKETYNINSIKEFIENNKDADILYISAHGSYNRKQNIAGIMVGDDFWIASEDMFVPPIVLLSACHVSPRGIGVVNIADNLISNGAITVLGTFIPVDAKRNLKLMARLFTYILEAMNGNNQYKTLDEAWCGIVATNAIYELMASSKRFKKWMHKKNNNGVVRISEFQSTRCVNKLRNTHAYSDTIKIIKDMLDEENMSEKFANILDGNDYFPESFFYQFIGYPENVFLYNEIFHKAYNQNIL